MIDLDPALRLARTVAVGQAVVAALVAALCGVFVLVNQHDAQRDRATGNSDAAGWDDVGTVFAVYGLVVSGVLALAYGIPAARLRADRAGARFALLVAEAFTALVLLRYALTAWTNPVGLVVWLAVAASVTVVLTGVLRHEIAARRARACAQAGTD